MSQGLGAQAYSYKEENWDEELLKATEGKGFDIILDCVGADFGVKTVNLLAEDSRWVVFGLMGGANMQVEFSKLLRKRATVLFTTLKARSPSYKA